MNNFTSSKLRERLTDSGARRYVSLKAKALSLAKEFDLSEAAFQRLFDEGLIPLDQLITEISGAVTTDEAIEIEFSRLARAIIYPRKRTRDAYPTVRSVLDVAIGRFNRLLEQKQANVFELLLKGGAEIQEVAGALIPPAPSNPFRHGPGRWEKKEIVPKTAQMVTELLKSGFFADDLFIYRCSKPASSLRKAPYNLIEIPKLGRQIAVCDQMGEISFVSTVLLPFQTWASMTKEELKELPGVHAVRYGPEWAKTAVGIILDDHRIDVSKLPKHRVRKPSSTPLIPEAQLIEWIKNFHEKEQRWPYQRDTIVWAKDEHGNWIETEESWRNIQANLIHGNRGLPGGSSLPQFRRAHGLDDMLLTEAGIVRLVKLFFEKEGRWPTVLDDTVWDKDENQNWKKIDDSWRAIDSALKKGNRGLIGQSSLGQLRDANGLTTDNSLNEPEIVRLIKLYHEKTGKWPSLHDQTMWDKDAKGGWIEIHVSWLSIDMALRHGYRGLPGGSSLAQLRNLHGLTSDNSLNAAMLVRLIRLFHERGQANGLRLKMKRSGTRMQKAIGQQSKETGAILKLL